MKRTLLIAVAFALVLAACATTAPGTPGVITAVNGNTVTVSNAGSTTTYTLTRNTNIYSPDGTSTQRSYLTSGQRVLVWADGTNAVRINIEP